MWEALYSHWPKQRPETSLNWFLGTVMSKVLACFESETFLQIRTRSEILTMTPTAYFNTICLMDHKQIHHMNM